MKWKIWFLLSFLIFTSANYGADVYTVPLNFGRENLPVQFERLHIEPNGLYINHYGDGYYVVTLFLELSVKGNWRKTKVELKHYHWTNRQEVNYPLVFEKYLLALEINEGNVSLTVERLDFDKFFYAWDVVIENLSISFLAPVHADYPRPPPGPPPGVLQDENQDSATSSNSYRIRLATRSNSQVFSFSKVYFLRSESELRASNDQWFKTGENGELVLDWEGYRITIDRTIKIKVSKIP
ncbi:MAG: hypothetical protein LBH44_02175 [Treponema sp.]|jgi:hypothetical protein|nr:hypothetical protein [Treponema sp.]